MRFYVSKCNDSLNGTTYSPESVTPYLCLNPYYKVTLDPAASVRYMLDSGAFQDVRSEGRLSPERALDRQLAFERTVGVRAESIVSYDRLVDEQVRDGTQVKERVSESVGRGYVDETVDAAVYLASQRDRLEGRRLILSCQGASTSQYMDCVRQVLDVARPDDIIGLGGFCILSRSREYERQYYEVLTEAVPMIREHGIRRIHIFGMGVFRALVQTEMYSRLHGIECSYDTSSVEVNSVFGKMFDPVNGQMAGVFSKVHKKHGYIPAETAMFNVRMVTEYWSCMERMLDAPPEDFVPGIFASDVGARV